MCALGFEKMINIFCKILNGVLCFKFIFIAVNLVWFFCIINLEKGKRDWILGLLFSPGLKYNEIDWVIVIQFLVFICLSILLFIVLMFSNFTVCAVTNNNTELNLGVTLRLLIFSTIIVNQLSKNIFERVCLGEQICEYDYNILPLQRNDYIISDVIMWQGLLLCLDVAYKNLTNFNNNTIFDSNLIIKIASCIIIQVGVIGTMLYFYNFDDLNTISGMTTFCIWVFIVMCIVMVAQFYRVYLNIVSNSYPSRDVDLQRKSNAIGFSNIKKEI